MAGFMGAADFVGVVSVAGCGGCGGCCRVLQGVVGIAGIIHRKKKKVGSSQILVHLRI